MSQSHNTVSAIKEKKQTFENHEMLAKIALVVALGIVVATASDDADVDDGKC